MSNIRKFIKIVESAVSHPEVDQKFLQAVRKKIRTGGLYGDYELPSSNSKLSKDISHIFGQILYSAASANNTLCVYREEHRPKADVKDPGTLGIYWCWNANTAFAPYGQELGKEIHQNVKLIEVTYEALVSANDVDWVSTIAANLALPDEREITIKENTSVKLTEVYIGNKSYLMNKTANITNIGQYDNI